MGSLESLPSNKVKPTKKKWLKLIKRAIVRSDMIPKKMVERLRSSNVHADKPTPVGLKVGHKDHLGNVKPMVSDEDIRAAYRFFLNREPDVVGFSTFRQRAENGLTHADLFAEMSMSDERATLHAQHIVEVDVLGVTVCVDETEREFGQAIARDGVWEAHIINQIQNLLPVDGVFVDIGANVGVMSFHAARKVGASGRVIAFEPNPENVQRFLQGVVANGFEQIQMIPLAASDNRSVFGLKSGSNTYLAPAVAGMRLAQSVAADEFLATESRIDLIKIDIEGHEPFALRGLTKTIARHRPTILCEFNPRCLEVTGGQKPVTFAEDLFAIANSVDIIEYDGSLTAVDSADTLMTIWTARNAEHVERGTLPDGMLHFDLLLRT